MDKIKNKIILVIGSGRSGTSVITRSLEIFGVSLGDNLMPPKEGVNDKGFWEDQDLYRLNREYYAALNHDWDKLLPVNFDYISPEIVEEFKCKALQILMKKLEPKNLFGFKDPQITRLLPFWNDVFHQASAEVSFVICLRNPKSVAQSLSKYTGFSLFKSYLLWFEHTLSALIDTQGANRLVVDYDLFMQDPKLQLKRMQNTLKLPANFQSKDYLSFEADFLDKTLQHSSYVSEIKSDPAIPLHCKLLYEFVSKIAADEMDINGELVDKELRIFQGSQDSYIHFLEEIENSYNDLAIASRKIDQLTGQLKAQEVNFQNELKQQETTIKLNGERICELIEDFNSIRAEAESQKSVNHQLRSAFATLSQEREMLASRLSQIISERDAHILELSKTIESLVIDRDSQKEAVGQLRSAFATLSQEREMLASRLSQIISERDAHILELSKTIESLVIDRDSQKEAVGQLRSAFATLSQEREMLASRLSQIISERDAHILE